MKQGRKTRLVLSGAVIASLFSSNAFAATEKEKEFERRIEALELAFGTVKSELQTTRSALETSQAENSRLMKSITAVETKASETATKVAAVEKTAPPAKGFRVGNTTITLGGYVKLDALASSFSGGDPAANSLINDYYFPAQIPVGGRGEGVNLTTSVRETRFLIQTETQIRRQKSQWPYRA